MRFEIGFNKFGDVKETKEFYQYIRATQPMIEDDYYSIAKLKLVKHYSTKELLQIWKEQRIKSVYYK